jgi:hypothetical protein
VARDPSAGADGRELNLPYSDAFFVRAFPKEYTESFQDGHVRAFDYLGGVPTPISYDNSRIAVAAITGRRGRTPTREFLRLASHFLFAYRFCRVRRANERGHVEAVVGFARRNFLVPVPRAESWEALNAELVRRCQADLGRRPAAGQALQLDHRLDRRRQDAQPGLDEAVGGRLNRTRLACLAAPVTANGYASIAFDQQTCGQSGRPDSNRRRPAWEAGILPLNYARRLSTRHHTDAVAEWQTLSAPVTTAGCSCQSVAESDGSGSGLEAPLPQRDIRAILHSSPQPQHRFRPGVRPVPHPRLLAPRPH